MRPGVHRQRTAHGPGDTGQKLSAGKPESRRKAGNLGARSPRLGAHTPFAATLQSGETPLRLDNSPGKPSVADQKTAAQSEPQKRLGRVQAAQKDRKIPRVGRAIELARRPPNAPARMTGQWLISPKRTAQRHQPRLQLNHRVRRRAGAGAG